MARKKKEEIEEITILDSSILDSSAIEEYAKEGIETPVKKKRGRPRKPRPEYQEYIPKYVIPTIEHYKDFLKSTFSKEERISLNEWKVIKDIVLTIDNDCKEFSMLIKPYSSTISKKTDSQYKIIDQVREEQSKKFIMDFFNNPFIEDVHRYYMIYLHLHNYIFESSKECNI